MNLEIVTIGDPVLRTPSEPVGVDAINSTFIQELITSMVETMRKAPGVGLAGPQVGEGVQMFVAEDGEQYYGTMSSAPAG